MAASALVYLGASLMTGVVAAGRTRAVLWIALCGLLVNLVGNALLVPSLGIEGAAIATLCTEGTVVLAATFVLIYRGAPPFGAHPALWALGPLLFAVGRFVSDRLLPSAWL